MSGRMGFVTLAALTAAYRRMSQARLGRQIRGLVAFNASIVRSHTGQQVLLPTDMGVVTSGAFAPGIGLMHRERGILRTGQAIVTGHAKIGLIGHGSRFLMTGTAIPVVKGLMSAIMQKRLLARFMSRVTVQTIEALGVATEMCIKEIPITLVMTFETQTRHFQSQEAGARSTVGQMTVEASVLAGGMY